MIYLKYSSIIVDLFNFSNKKCLIQDFFKKSVLKVSSFTFL